MEFKCVKSSGKRKVCWNGQINKIIGVKENCEMDVTARGSYFHVIFGAHSNGNYLCIPNWDVGCEIADFSDLFWNTERLAKSLNMVDAITIATALREAGEILEG